MVVKNLHISAAIWKKFKNFFWFFFQPPTPICNEQKFFDTNYLNGNSEDNTITNLKLAPELPPRKSRHSLSADVSGLMKVSKRGRSG